MKINKQVLMLCLASAVILGSCADKNKEDSSRYTYETVEGDPLGTMIYTLDNGLKVYMSVNREEPRVVTQIAVRTGSKQDPADATGLAHYLEHMLFKGTSKLGTKDWEAEQAVLQQISDLYEVHRTTTGEDERKAIYSQIDSLSSVAASYSISNEYDKMTSSLGARGTNAYTSNEQTVYINDIPANELDKWAALEAERFKELVLRLFHTELEAVYEEFNRGQDSDMRNGYYTMMENLFPTHQYGTQTTIGTSEHLKNPSMVKIHEYFEKHYIPNNMAIILSGDIDPDATVDIIEKHFGSWEAGEVPTWEPAQEAPIEVPIVKDIQGVEAEFVMLGYRLPGVQSDEAIKAQLLDGILSNGQAGLIDLNLVQSQKVLNAYSSSNTMQDYSMFMLQGNPRQGQSLEEVADLLRGEVEKVKTGDFPDWMIEAVVNDMKLTELRRSESNWARASSMVDAFITHRNWSDVVSYYDRMGNFSKEDVVAFANTYFSENYVQINKRTGENMAVKVDKPAITPVEIDRESKSPFYTAWDSVESGRLSPQFLDYNALISKTNFSNGIEFNSIENQSNELFSLYYVLEMGTDNDQLMGLAVSYLPYLGTDQYTAEELAQELFKLGVSFDVFSSRDRIYVTLRGLNSSLDEGVKLFEHILSNVQPDEQALNDMVEGTLKKRQDALKNKNQVLFSAMLNYAQYGVDNPHKYIMSEEALRNVSAEELVQRIREITSYDHFMFYYGPQEEKEVMALVDGYHKVPAELKAYPEARAFPELPIDNSQVFFTHFDMVQSEIMLVAKGPTFDKDLMAPAELFNQYFGSGLSSIVFQEIRESKALAYSAYSVFTTPAKADESHYVRAYIGAQVDKLPEATDAMLELMSEMPRADIQFESARDAALKQIEANRITRESIFWNYLSAKRRGMDYDVREQNYNALQAMNMEELQAFFDTQIKGQQYTYCVIGNKDMVDLEVLKKLGPVKTLGLEELFGYKADAPMELSMNKK
jgi:predicted Zn-dependent peptidase